MNKSKFAILVDSIFISILISLLNFVWLNKIIKNANLFYFFLILLFLSTIIVISVSLFKLNGRKILKSNNDKFLNSAFQYLITCNKNEYINFIIKLINCKHIDDYLFKLEKKFIYLNIQTTLTDRDFLLAQELYYQNKTSNSTLFILYRNKDKNFDEILSLSQNNYQLISSEIISKLMQKNNLYPIEKATPSHKSFKQKVTTFFKSKTKGISRSHFKEIFFTSISLIFLSFITPFSNYYLILGTILLLISIITLFMKNTPQKNSEADFLLK